MDRRGMLSMVGALALAAVMGLGATAAEKSKGIKAVCACCGDACACTACTCDATAKAGVTGKGCECCVGAACCPASRTKAVNIADGEACCEKDSKAVQVSKASCACCGDACTCPACSCDATARMGAAKAGKGCECCGGDACCTSSTEVARANTAVVR